MTSQWREQATEMLHSAASDVTSAYPALSPTCAVGSGGDWQHVVDSVELGPEDLLVLGSSRLGPLARCSSAPPRRRFCGTALFRFWSFPVEADSLGEPRR